MIVDFELKFVWGHDGARRTIKWIGGEHVMVYDKTSTQYLPINKSSDELIKLQEDLVKIAKSITNDEE